MKVTKLKWFNILMVLMIIPLLVSCAQETPAVTEPEAPAVVQPEAPAAEEPEAPAAEPAEKVKIVYWSMFSEGEPLQILLDQATKDFMVEFPNIEVEVKWAGRQVLTQLQSAIAAGTQVDIVDHSDDRVLNAIVKSGLALPMDKYLGEKAYDSEKTWGETFAPGVLDLGQIRRSDLSYPTR